MAEKKSPAVANRASSRGGAKTTAAAKKTERETASSARAKSTSPLRDSSAKAERPGKRTTAAPVEKKRTVARPVTRVVRPEAERVARPAAPVEKRQKRAKAAAKPLPTAPAGHAPLIGPDGSASGSIALPAVLATPAKRIATVFQAFIAERANARQATAATKNRARVAGGGAKPWRQKGTGRARQGSIRSPQWRHGGVVFGPNGRKYKQRMPEKMRRAAFAEAMSARASEGRVLVFDSMNLGGDRPRTRDVVTWLGNIGDTGATIIVWNEMDEGLSRAMANLPELEIRTPGSLRLSDVLEADTLLVMRHALDALAARAREAGVRPSERVLAPTSGAGGASEGSRG
ncbi:MAG: 50S ribosomal protein L4 [Candidatus Limnocylindria bacterium]|nr:50S ribosomal protein L4 [Candidatus Limnocylindria bacterium]